MSHSVPSNRKEPDFAAASVPDTLAALQVNPETGLTHAEVDARRKEHGYNEVPDQQGHPVLRFLGKFWGVSAWMLELIIVLSAVLGKYSDLVVVSVLLMVNAVLSFLQERRAAGFIYTKLDRGHFQVRINFFADTNEMTVALKIGVVTLLLAALRGWHF